MESTQSRHFAEVTNLIWNVAELLRGDLKQSEYGRVILPLTVLRRLDQVLLPGREAVWKLHNDLAPSLDEEQLHELLKAEANLPFYNVSKLTFPKLLDDSNSLARNLNAFVAGFSPDARRIFGPDGFDLHRWIERLDSADLLYKVVGAFANVDLSPEKIDSHSMGYIFEELIRRWAEQSNETAGEHFTPREVIRLMVNLLFIDDEDVLATKGIVKTLYDPACGTGGMLHEAERHLLGLNPDAELMLHGQELNGESWAICVADMLIKGHDPSRIHDKSSFRADGEPDSTFDYCIANPPFGVKWDKDKAYVERESETLGWEGRFGAGLPGIKRGELLFLQHMVSKMKPVEEGGSRVAIVFNGGPLFSGGADSGESNIRRWLIENDLLEGIVGLPDQLFYNSGIHTYFWIITNRKSDERKGTVQLLDGRTYFRKMRKSLGDKRNELADDHIEQLTRLYGAFEEGPHCQIKALNEFGFQRVPLERPLRQRYVLPPQNLDLLADSKSLAKLDAQDRSALIGAFRSAGELKTQNVTEFERRFKDCVSAAGVRVSASILKQIREGCCQRDDNAPIVLDKKGNPCADTELRDAVSVPLSESVDDFLRREVADHAPDAWPKEPPYKIGYSIPFTKYFYEYDPSRDPEMIESEMRALEARVDELQIQLVDARESISARIQEAGLSARWGRIGHYCRTGSGTTPKADVLAYYVESGGTPWLSSGEAKSRWIAGTSKQVSDLAVATHSALKIWPKGAVVVAMYGGGTVGESGVLGIDTTVNQACCVLVPDVRLYAPYLYHVLQALKPTLIELAVGGSQVNLSQEIVRDFKVPIPPISEQEEIAQSCDQILKAVRSMSGELASRIDLLSEYRHSLISTAVTGNVDMSGIAAPTIATGAVAL